MSKSSLKTETPADTAARRAAEAAELRHQQRLDAQQRQFQRRQKAKDRRATQSRQGGSFSDRSHLGRAEHGGALKFGDMALALAIGAGSALWTATRSHSTGDDLLWAAGSTLIGGIVAVEAREGTEVEYGAAAIAAANAAYGLLRLTGGITQGG